MKKNGTLFFIVCLMTISLLCFMDGKASAVTLTFEGYENEIYGAPITRDGFDIGNPQNEEQHFHEITSTDYGLPSNGTGVLLNDRNTEIFVIANAGSGFSTFTVSQVDVASALNNYPAVGLTVYGYLNNVLIGSLIVSNLGTGYTTLSGSSLGTVDRLVFDGDGGLGGFVFDNLTLNPGGSQTVPEPISMLLLGFGLTGLAGVRRFRK
jgi:hypothetical protein